MPSLGLQPMLWQAEQHQGIPNPTHTMMQDMHKLAGGESSAAHIILLLLLPAVRLVAAQLGWQVVPPGSADSQWDLFWTDTSISQERLLRLAPTQVRSA
jgi:hypothetical protein